MDQQLGAPMIRELEVMVDLSYSVCLPVLVHLLVETTEVPGLHVGRCYYDILKGTMKSMS